MAVRLLSVSCQRWVSEKLSVESLRDLELFGGEAQRKLSYGKKGLTLPPHVCSHEKRSYVRCDALCWMLR